MNEIKKDIAELKLQDLDMVSGGCTSANDMRTCPVCGRSVDAADFVNHIRSSHRQPTRQLNCRACRPEDIIRR